MVKKKYGLSGSIFKGITPVFNIQVINIVSAQGAVGSPTNRKMAFNKKLLSPANHL
jgi:hypothetical protein